MEKRWRTEWSKTGVYEVDMLRPLRPYYNLMMFPYPSAEGLHVGNMMAFTGADVHGRYKRMQGFEVFEPIGLDGFGIHSENFAIKIGRHPMKHAEISEENFYRQLNGIGNGFAWDYRLETYKPEYYKWTQWLFVQMFKGGLAYKDVASVNWCPQCKTVLADEQVEGGKCERCKNEVVKKSLSSWYFRITNYADDLLKGLDKIRWPKKVVTAQKQWIGKSEGRLIKFKTIGSDSTIPVFTTRPDTLNAVTFIATSKLYDPASPEAAQGKGKVGEFTGQYVTSPIDGRKIPIWDTNYVAPDYGTGYVMGVPAHDDRDLEFATKYKIDILDKEPESNDFGEVTVNYHLRDWLISRQRYWGPPIPMIHCPTCAEASAGTVNAGWHPVPEDELPVLLPDVADFKPKGDGTSPLSNAPELWKYPPCPKCGKRAKRELDVSDTFLDSSWYFLRYPSIRSARSGQAPFDSDITKAWLPVDAYIGGAEHAVLHLLYARFVWRVLVDQGDLPKELGDEPFPFLFSHGLIIKDGAKMSKSKGNVVNPDEYIEKYGADTLRVYLMFLGPYEQGGDFRDSGIEGMRRFLDRVWKLIVEKKDVVLVDEEDAREVLIKMHKTIKKVTHDIEKFDYNTAISAVMEFVNLLKEKSGNGSADPPASPEAKRWRAGWDQAMETLVQLIAPFAPFMAEEAWVEILGREGSVHKSEWPKYNEKLTEDANVTVAIQVNGKLRTTVEFEVDDSRNRELVIKVAKDDKNISKWIKGAQIKDTVFVPGKLVNFVTS